MKIYIIGTGNMGSAIVQALRGKGLQVFVNDANRVKALKLAKFGAVFDKNLEKLRAADIVVLAVKPHDLPGLAGKTAKKIHPASIIVSIAAGVKIKKIQKLFNHNKIVRVMPNLGLLVGQGVAMWKPEGLSPKEIQKCGIFLENLGEQFQTISESQIDSFTAISGSGPAYFAYFAQGLENAARDFGFNQKIARLFVKKAFFAAAALQTQRGYQELIDRISSKRGTTKEALEVFKRLKLHQIILKAAKAARKRSVEIANE